MSTDFAPTPAFYIIVSLVVGLTLGWVIGFFDSNNRTAKKIKTAEEKSAIAIQEAEQKIARANQKLAEQAAQPPVQQVQQIINQDDPGLLRLKNNGGYFGLEMDGAKINSALSPDGKKRLIELLTVIRPYLEGNIPPQAPPPAAPAPQVSPAVQVAQPVISSPAQFSAPAPAPEEQPKTVVKTTDKKAMAALSMVGQIDAVLQERLLNTTLAKRGIRVTESPEGGVRVEVGMEKFETIDDVTDPEVKAFIRASIAEWEKKFTPGI